MLDYNTPCNITCLLYATATNEFNVRLHRSTDDNSLWVCASDMCDVLNITNPSYISRKLKSNYVHKHKCKTNGGVQPVIWLHIDGVLWFLHEQNTEKSLDFYEWLLKNRYLSVNQHTKHSFKNPVMIERDTLNKLISIIHELKQQGL